MPRFRLLANEADFERMKDLLRDNYVSAGWLFPGPCDLEYWRYIYDESPDLIRNTGLWEDDAGGLVAFAWMNEDGADYAIRAGAEPLLSEVLAWSERTRLAGELLGERLDSNRISVSADREDEIAVAEAFGYERNGLRTAVFVREMDALPGAGRLPEGVVVRSIEREDLESRARLNEIAQDQELDPASYQRLFSRSTLYRKDLDIVAEVEGQLVAFCTGWADPRTKLGLVEPFGCRAEYRRRGITGAVVSECLTRLAGNGMARVYATHGGLGLDEEDETIRFNLAMGFREVASVLELERRGMRS